MRVEDVFVLICTDKMIECRDFYMEHFGFEVDFASTIYIQLKVATDSGGGFSIAFMPPDHPFGDGFREVFSGKGAYITIRVDDAQQVYERVKARGAPIIGELKDEKWGQRHFLTMDPNGTFVDVVEAIVPAEGYYDKYQLK